MVLRMAGWQGRDIRLARVICRMCVSKQVYNYFLHSFYSPGNEKTTRLENSGRLSKLF